MYICFMLQTVVQPVGMGEPAIVHLPMLTVTVPVSTQDPTARPEVCIAAHTTMQHGGSWSMEHTRTYVRTYVVQPVRTEEPLEGPLLRLRSLSVVFATQGHTART